MVVSMRIAVFWDPVLYHLTESDQHIRGDIYLMPVVILLFLC